MADGGLGGDFIGVFHGLDSIPNLMEKIFSFKVM